MKKLNISVKVDEQVVAKFYLESDAQLFAETIHVITGKRVVVETKDVYLAIYGAKKVNA